ncbi:hypothetical protein GE061_001256 [Apolygus lucorum]|uniref:Glycosyltransferase family 92 protein n=1 Tax=Apolygus lucorum TaxID=248454 RepID=A0A8S9YA45_APOLU|nr:hypothetical protein GE061_001256 [Apolygus lucorum]
MRRPLAKLLLFFVAFVGLTGMFLYKLKYEQMKSIVDGAGLEAVDRYLHANYLLPTHSANYVESSFGFPPVSWKSISQHFVFSAFLCQPSDAQPSETREFCALGFGPDVEPVFGCSVWFDLGKEILSVPGTFSFSSDATESTSSLMYEFRCSVTNLKSFHRHPYMFVLKTTDSEDKILIPVYKPGKPSSTTSSVLCVYPDFVGYEWKWMIEFFTYHNIIGFTDIIAYDSGINFGFLEKMKKVIKLSKGTLKSLSVIRWDFPSNDPASSVLVEKDCIQRSFGASNLTVILNWNQYFVPSKDKNINALVTSLGDIMPFKTRMPTKRCCTDAIDDRRSGKNWPLILKKTLCIPNKEPGFVYIHPSPGSELSSDNSDLADLLTYSQCQGLALSEIVPVFSMWKYSSDIRSNDVLQMWEKSDIFSITSS